MLLLSETFYTSDYLFESQWFLILLHYSQNVNHHPAMSSAGEIIISLAHNSHFKRDKQPNLFHYRLPSYTPVLCWDTHGWSEWGWMVGLGMLGASRLSSIWAGRCAEEKTTTQRARSPSGDQFMVLALSLPVKKQISWCVFKKPPSEKHHEEIFSPSVSLSHLLIYFPSTLAAVVHKSKRLVLTHSHTQLVTYIC